jgi:hypothetical protein
VQVARCDLDKKLLDFVVVDKNNPPRGAEELASKKGAPAAPRDKKGKGKSKGKKKSAKHESKREGKRRRK